MKKYIGTKIISAEPMQKDGKDGYKVVYDNPNNTKYESWSPKNVFEESYTLINEDSKLVRDKMCEIINNVNNMNNLFLPQQYLWDILNEMEKHNFTSH